MNFNKTEIVLDFSFPDKNRTQTAISGGKNPAFRPSTNLI